MSLPRRTLLHAAAVASLSAGLLALPAGAAANVAVAPSSQLATALSALTTSGNASALAAEIAAFTASPRTAYLGIIDTLIDSDVGHSVITAPHASAPVAPALEATLSALAALTPSSPNAAQQQAAAELQVTVLGGGLSSLLSAVNSANAGNAVSQLAALQKLVPGATVPAGSLSSVAGVLSSLATVSTAAGTLNTAASALTASTPITPSALSGVAAQLAAISDSTVVGSSGVTVAQASQALAAELDSSGTLFGALTTFGTSLAPTVDPSDITTALTQVTNLLGVAPGAKASAPELASVLNAVAALPGVAATASASPLLAAASALEGSISPSQTLSVATSLTSTAGALPAPLNSLITGLASAISASGGVFGTVSGLSIANADEALSELSSLSGLGAGSSTSALPGIAAVLNQVSSDIPSGDANQAAALSDLVSIFSSDSLDSDHLSGAAQALGYIAQTLPAPVATTIADLASTLSADASAMAAPSSDADEVAADNSGSANPVGGSGSGSSTSSVSPTASNSSTSKSPGSASTTPTGSSSAATPLTEAVRSGNRVTITLSCAAARKQRCSDTVSAAETGAHTVTLHETVAGHTHRTITLSLDAVKGRGRARAVKHRPAITLTVTSGHRRIRRILA